MILALGPWFDNMTGEFLLSRHFLDWVGTLLGHEVASLQTMPGIWHNLIYSYDGSSRGYVYLTYLVSGHSLIALGLALFGGRLGQWFHATGKCAGSDEIQVGP